MKHHRRTLAMILSVILCVCLFALPVMAQTTSQDGLEVTLTTDKAEYVTDENIVATLTVKNTTEDAFNDLYLEHIAPKGFEAASGEANKVVDSLAAGESVTIEVTYTGKIPATGDMGVGPVIIVMVLAAAGLTALLVTDKKLRITGISMLLCCILVGGLVVGGAATAHAAALSKSITASTAVKVDGTELTLKAKVSQNDEVYNGLKASQLDAIPSIEADEFQSYMDVTWNFGWEGNQTLEHNATKVDFDGTADPSAKLWKIGTVGEEGTASTGNAGYGVSLWTKGEGSKAFMYSKVDVPEHATQFRVWAVGNTSEHWSGSGAFRTVALYKDENGDYVKKVLTPIADSFIGNKTTTVDADGYIHFSNAAWNLPDTLDGCMVIFGTEDIKGKDDVIILVESIGVGAVKGTAETEALKGVANGDVMPEMVIVKRVGFIVETPAEPAVHNGLTAEQLEAIPSIEAGEFQSYMDVTWNFGWEGNATLEHNATKVDFDGTAGADSKLWKIGTFAEEGAASVSNAGWGVTLWTKGAGNVAYMYSKLDVPANVTQFRIWAVGLTNEHWSGNGAIRAVAVYKDDSGKWVKEVLVPIADTFIGNKTTVFNAEDGTTRFYNAQNWLIPDVLDNCMLIYNMDNLKGREDVVIFVEGVGMGEKLGTADTEAIGGVPNGSVMPENLVIKRVIFC